MPSRPLFYPAGVVLVVRPPRQLPCHHSMNNHRAGVVSKPLNPHHPHHRLRVDRPSTLKHSSSTTTNTTASSTSTTTTTSPSNPDDPEPKVSKVRWTLETRLPSSSSPSTTTKDLQLLA